MKKIVNSLLGIFSLQLIRKSKTNNPGPVNDILDIGGKSVEFYYDFLAGHRFAPWLSDKRFRDLHEKVKGNTLVDIDRCYELYDLINYIQDVPGDVIEIGVWRGGTATIIASKLKDLKLNKKFYLCDTFEGVVNATSFDLKYKGKEHSDTSIDIVKNLLQESAIENYKLLVGIFPEQTASQINNETTFSFCHIDVDVYLSAKNIVEWIYPKLSKNGIIVFDDYGFKGCNGVTYLVNELKQDTEKWMFIYNMNGHAILVKK